MKHSKNNVFYMGGMLRPHSPQAVWQNIRLFFRRFKWAYQRATRGYCDFDIWEMDSFYLNLFRESLHELANTTNGYPSDMTFEEWQKYLHKTAACFYRANEYNDYYPTPMYKKWREHGKKYPTERNPYTEKMFEESKHNAELRNEDLAQGLFRLYERFNHLWD